MSLFDLAGGIDLDWSNTNTDDDFGCGLGPGSCVDLGLRNYLLATCEGNRCRGAHVPAAAVELWRFSQVSLILIIIQLFECFEASFL